MQALERNRSTVVLQTPMLHIPLPKTTCGQLVGEGHHMPGVVFQQVANGLFNSQSEAAEATEAVLTLATKVAHRTRSGGSNTHSLGRDPVLGPCSVYVRTDPRNRTKSCSAKKTCLSDLSGAFLGKFHTTARVVSSSESLPRHLALTDRVLPGRSAELCCQTPWPAGRPKMSSLL